MLSRFKKILLSLISLCLIGLPTLALAAGTPTGVPTLSSLSSFFGTASLAEIIVRGLQIFFALLGIIFLGLLIYAGFNWMTSQGDPEKVDRAKRMIYNAIAGLAIIFSALAIVTFVFNVLGLATGGSSKCDTEGEIQAFGCTGVRTCSGGLWAITTPDNQSACGGFDFSSNKFANIFKFSDSSLPNWQASWSETYRQTGTVRLPRTDTLKVYAFARNYLSDGAISSLSLFEKKDDNAEKNLGAMALDQNFSDNTFNKARASLAWAASSITYSTTTLRVGVNGDTYYSNYLKVKFLAPSCFDGIKNNDETGIDCGGECGACDGESCSLNGACADDNCSSGICGSDCRCVSRPVITYIDPADDPNNDTNRNNLTAATTDDDISNGAPGNYITIWGRNFGNATGTVYFEVKDGGGQTSAALAPCVKSWNNNQIIAVVPTIAAGDYRVIVGRSNGSTQTLFSDGWPFLINAIQRPGLCSASPRSGLYPATTTLIGYGFPTTEPRDIIWLINNSNVTSTRETGWTATSVVDTALEGSYRGRTSLRLYNGSVFSNSVFFQLSSGQAGDPCGYDSQGCNQDIDTCQAELVCGSDCTCQVPTGTTCTDDEIQDCYVGGCKGTQTCSGNVWGNCVDDSGDSCLPYLNNRTGIAAFAWAFTAQKKTGAGMSCSSDIWNDDTCDINGCIGQNLFCKTDGNDSEWLEIYNPTANDLRVYKIYYGVSASNHQEKDLNAGAGINIPAGQFIAINNSDFSSATDLLSSQGYIALVAADDSIIDEISYGTTTNTFGLAPMSFGRKEDGLDTNSDSDFKSFTVPSKGVANSTKQNAGNHLVINEVSIASDPCTCMPTSIVCKAGQVKTEGCEPVGQCDYVKRCQTNGSFGECEQQDPGCVPYVTVPSATIAAYSWSFNANNGDNGKGPKVVTDCDRTNNCGSGESLPSPSPWSGKWNKSNYPYLAIDNQYACLNAVISARFTKPMDAATLNSSNIKIYKLNGTSWAPEAGLINSVETALSVGESGVDSIILSLNDNLSASTTYAVFLSKNIKDEVGRPLESDDNGVSSINCSEIGLTDPGVCWTFETRSASDPKKICDLGCVDCSPNQYFNRYYGQEKNHGLNPISRDNVCMMLDRTDYGWDWSEREQTGGSWSLQTVLANAFSWLTNPPAADGTGVASQSAGSQFAGLATTTAYRETAWQSYVEDSSWFSDNDSDYFRIAGAEKIGQVPGYCLAHNNFTDPIIIENQYCTKNPDPAKRVLQSPSPWKGQRDACVNTAIFALFSRNMKNDTLVNASNGQPTANIQLYKCNNEAQATSSDPVSGCTSVSGATASIFEYNHNELTMADLQTAIDNGGNTNAEGFRIFTPAKLDKESWYKVVIKGGNGGVRGGDANENAEGILQIPNRNALYKSAGNINSYYWYFRTGSEECPIDEVNVLPQAKLMAEVGLTQKYESDPTAANCNHLNPFGYVWNWQSLINPFDERCLTGSPASGDSIATICALDSRSCDATDSALTVPFVKAYGKTEGLTDITARAGNTQSEGQNAACSNDKWGFGKLQIGLGGFRINSTNNTDCLNTEISAGFSKNSLSSSLKVSGGEQNVFLYECPDAECLNPTTQKGLVLKYPDNGEPANASGFQVVPSQNLATGTSYRMVVKGGDDGIKSEQGTPLDEKSLNFGFSTNGGEECDSSVAPWNKAPDNAFCDNNCTYKSVANLCGTKSEQCNNNGLVAYYDFNSQAFNRTGLFTYGGATSSLKYVSGVAGQALSLKSPEFLSLNNTILNNFVSSRKGMIALWVRPLNTVDNQGGTIFTFKSAGNLNLQISIADVSPLAFQAYYSDGAQGATITSSGNYKITDWRHLAVAYDVSDAKVLTLKFYVDGKLAGQKTVNDFDVAGLSAMSLNGGSGASNSFSGDIDELAIYNRALSDAEIAALNNGKSPKNVTYNCGLNCQNLGNSFTTTTPGVYKDLPICGNSKVEGGEDCDDGNSDSGDGCSNVCLSTGNTTMCGNGKLDNGQPDSYSWVFQLSDTAKICQAVSFGKNPCPNGVWSLTADRNITNLQFRIYQGSNSDGTGCISDSEFSKLSFWRSVINYFAKLIKKFFGFGSVTAANFWCPVSQTTLSEAELTKIKRGNYYATTTVTDLGAENSKTVELIAYPNNSDNLQINLIRQDSNWGKKTEYKFLALYEKNQIVGTSTAYINTTDGLCALNSVRFDVWPKGLAKNIDSFFCASDPKTGKPDECGRYTESAYDDDMSASWTKNQDSGYDLDANANINNNGITVNPATGVGAYKDGNQHLYRLWAVSEQGFPVRANFYDIDLTNISGSATSSVLARTPYNGDLWVTAGFKAGRSLLTVQANDTVPSSGEQAAGDVTGNLPIITYLCNNPWPSPENFPFVDSPDNCIAETGTCINANFSTYYCRDAGIAQKCVKGDKIGQECQTNAACWNNKDTVQEGSCQLYTADDLPDLGVLTANDKIARGISGTETDRLKEFIFAGVKAGIAKNYEIPGGLYSSVNSSGSIVPNSPKNTGSVYISNTGTLNYDFVAPENGKYKLTLVTSNNSNIDFLPAGFDSNYGTDGQIGSCNLCQKGEDLVGNKFQHNLNVKVDGAAVGNLKVWASAPTNPQNSSIGELVNLSKGKHAISIIWDNDCCCKGDSCLVDGVKKTMDSNFRLHKLVLEEVVSSDGTSSASDAIGIRIYSNSNYYSPTLWYKNKFGSAASQANLEELIVDGNQAVREGRTTYVNAPDLGDSNGPELSDMKAYSDILLMSYNEGASASTQKIYGQLLENLFFNAGNNIYRGGLEYLPDACSSGSQQCFTDKDCQVRGTGYCLSSKAMLTRDNIRLSDIGDIYVPLNNYHSKLRCSNDFSRSCTNNSGCYGGGTCGHFYPNLAAGSYITGKSLSVWPSWQATLGKELGATLPIDPLNKILKNEANYGVKCASPYNPDTCWDEKNKLLECNLSQDSDFYAYYGNRSGSSAKVYSGYEYLLNIWQKPAYLDYNPFALFDGQLNNGFCGNISDTCGNGRIESGENCSTCPLDAGCGATGTSCQQFNGNWSCRPIKNCGDGYKNIGEECDLGTQNGATGSGCSTSCQCVDGYDCSGNSPRIVCGDGRIIGDEECEFILGQSVFGGNRFSASYNGQGICNPLTCKLNDWVTDNCSGLSTSTFACLNNFGCGDGIKQDGEQCDCGSAANPIYSVRQTTFGYPFACPASNINSLPTGSNSQVPFCNTNCQIGNGYCGDGIWNGNEECERAMNNSYCCNSNCTHKTDGVCADGGCLNGRCWAPDDGRCNTNYGEPATTPDCSGATEEDEDDGDVTLDCTGADWQVQWGSASVLSNTRCTKQEVCSYVIDANQNQIRTGPQDPGCDKKRPGCPPDYRRWVSNDTVNNDQCCRVPENGISFSENFATEKGCSVQVGDRITLRANEDGSSGWISANGNDIKINDSNPLVFYVSNIGSDGAIELNATNNNKYAASESGNLFGIGNGMKFFSAIPERFSGYYFENSNESMGLKKNENYCVSFDWNPLFGSTYKKYLDADVSGLGSINESSNCRTSFNVCDENSNCNF